MLQEYTLYQSNVGDPFLVLLHEEEAAFRLLKFWSIPMLLYNERSWELLSSRNKTENIFRGKASMIQQPTLNIRIENGTILSSGTSLNVVVSQRDEYNIVVSYQQL